MMVLMMMTTALAAATEVHCADVIAMVGRKFSDLMILENTRAGTIYKDEVECIVASGISKAVQDEVMAQAIVRPYTPPAKDQYQCAMVPIWNSSAKIIPTKDASEARLAAVTLPAGWTPIGAVKGENLALKLLGATGENNDQVQIVICRIVP